MEIYALYLPQFHETEENNNWWGKGFTEWVNVKRAKPLYRGHVQPKHPIDDNYYDLLNKETVEWQTKQMHEYGIDGFIYYHYYFNGKLLLEKPAENLLKWKDIDQSFFFNWANHSWCRSWNGSKEILMEQTYGGVEEWEKHFNYLLPFFKDNRYKKIDNKPVLIIYDINFKEKNEMFEWFDHWCREEGFDGLYLIEECFSVLSKQYQQFATQKNSVTQKLYLTQPLVGRSLYNHRNSSIQIFMEKLINRLNQKGIIKIIKKYSGDDLLSAIMERKEEDKDIIPGLFFEWDNTPRHGHRGYIITSVSKEIFIRYMNYYKNSDLMIINAWNEWCEGMMLEPSQENGYKYLEWIQEWKQKDK